MTREEQTDWLCRLRADLNNGVIFTPWNKEFTEALNEVLEQEPKTGHWEMCEDADGIYGVCDVCGTDADFTHYGEAYPFCPNCGAKMESEDEKC